MPVVNLTLTLQSAVNGSVANATGLYSDDGSETSYGWSGTSGLQDCRYSTNFSSVVPSGATVTGYRFLIRARKSSLSFYPLPAVRWGTTGGGIGLGDYSLALTEDQYAYPPSGYYTTPPATWETIDIGGTLSTAGAATLFIDEFLIEVEYVISTSSAPILFLNENF